METTAPYSSQFWNAFAAIVERVRRSAGEAGIISTLLTRFRNSGLTAEDFEVEIGRYFGGAVARNRQRLILYGSVCGSDFCPLG